jgi:hypothetical protein
MSRWPKAIAEAVFFDIRLGLTFRVGSRSRPATDQEIDLVARAIVERLQRNRILRLTSATTRAIEAPTQRYDTPAQSW